MTDKETIIDKIRKLQAHADSAADIGNEAEAQAFAAKVQELLTAYKLSQHDLRDSGRVEAEPINITYLNWEDLNLKARTTRIAWAEQLAGLIGQAYYCHFVVTNTNLSAHSYMKHPIGFYVGAETDRQVATYMFVTLGRFLYGLAEKEDRKFKYQAWVAAGKPASGAAPEARGFKAGFISGFITRLRERFDDEIKPKSTQDDSSCAAIVLVRQDALNRVKAWEKDNNLNLRSCRGLRPDDGSHDVRSRGRAAANDLDLKGKAIEGSGKTRNQLT